MEYALLRSLRALGPGLILLGYGDVFLAFVLGQHAYFWELDSAKLFVVAYVIGGLYGVLASACRRDRYAFAGVQESILRTFQKHFPDLQGRKWREISPCFYKLIDTDSSLQQKSKAVRFNGFIVTTSFDAMWISVLAVCVGALAALYTDVTLYLSVAATVCVISYLVWRQSVTRHCELADEQVDVIGRRLSTDFLGCITEASRARSR